jgi:phenylalanine ammonia-lyase
LTIGHVVAVARHLARVVLAPEANDAINASNKTLFEKVADNKIIYGLNTGFGGSADTRPMNSLDLQQCLISHLTCGIVVDSTIGDRSKPVLPLQDPLAATCMPESWVRASMLIRLNSLPSVLLALLPSLEVYSAIFRYCRILSFLL